MVPTIWRLFSCFQVIWVVLGCVANNVMEKPAASRRKYLTGLTTHILPDVTLNQMHVFVLVW
jgi:hypothetical protein